MPLPASSSRIAPQALASHEDGASLILQAQATGQPGGTAAPEGQAVPPGTEHTQGAFGIFGMIISGLIVLFAIVLLIRRRKGR
jgi:hypothetical protein